MSNPHSDTIDVRLTNIRDVARETKTFEFRCPDGGALPSVDPGSHIDVYLPNGLVRQYSLTNSGVDPEAYVVGVKRDAASRGGSAFMCEHLRVGMSLKIGHPRNNFPLIEDAPQTIFVAGGIGITPIYCMMKRLAALGKPWKLFYSCRSRADATFLAELQSYDGVVVNFDDENNGQFLDLAGIVAAAPRAAHLYCCGPAPMLRAFEAASAEFPAEQVHVEYFTPKAEAATAGGYVVVLAKSNRELLVSAGKTILDVLRDAGLEVAHSCREGVCGACETAVLSGEPDHRDAILSEAERRRGKTMMICCSGSKGSRLVLDL